MSPEQIAASGSEDAHQAALFAWKSMAIYRGLKASLDENSYLIPGYVLENYKYSDDMADLLLLYAVPNGGYRDKRTAGKLKATGVVAGIPDINLDVPRSFYHGLRIELKRPKTDKQKKGILSKDQTILMDRLTGNNYLAKCCVGWVEARDTIINYLGLN